MEAERVEGCLVADKVLLSVPGRDFSVWPFMKNLSLKDFHI